MDGAFNSQAEASVPLALKGFRRQWRSSKLSWEDSWERKPRPVGQVLTTLEAPLVAVGGKTKVGSGLDDPLLG